MLRKCVKTNDEPAFKAARNELTVSCELAVSVGAVAVEVNANEHVESEGDEVEGVESIDFLEIGSYDVKYI